MIRGLCERRVCVLLGFALVRATRCFERKKCSEGRSFDDWGGLIARLSRAAGVALRRDGAYVTGFVEIAADRKNVQAELEEEVRWSLHVNGIPFSAPSASYTAARGA